MNPVSLSAQTVAAVTKKAAARGVLNHRTIVAGEGNVVGMAGEEMARTFLPGAIKVDSRDADFKMGNTLIDVKTRASDLRPRTDWDCKIPEYSVDNQKCDAYVFVISRKDGTSGFVLGWISKADFRKVARRETADRMFSQYGKHVVNQNYLVCRISDLKPMDTLVAFTKASV